MMPIVTKLDEGLTRLGDGTQYGEQRAFAGHETGPPRPALPRGRGRRESWRRCARTASRGTFGYPDLKVLQRPPHHVGATLDRIQHPLQEQIRRRPVLHLPRKVTMPARAVTTRLATSRGRFWLGSRRSRNACQGCESGLRRGSCSLERRRGHLLLPAVMAITNFRLATSFTSSTLADPQDDHSSTPTA